MVPSSKILLICVLCFIGLLLTATDIEKAAELRQAGDYSRAEKLLSEYSSPANFDQLNSTDKIEFLNGLLELAHVRALKDDVPGALALLNWAEGREDPYQRAIACVKYAEILIDLGEFERASGYLKNADEVITKRATDENTGAAIGQGGEVTDTGGTWRNLRDDSDALKAEVESEEMKKKFGATYGNYVKLRRLQRLVKRSRTPRYLKEALKVADEIIEIDPASQFAAAASYLKGEIFASQLKEESQKKDIREVKDYLNKFVRQQPDGLYRGEALMLLGKISLEIEWNAKDAEKYYAQALEYFRKAREKRDAVSLYAAINDDLKKQSTPTQKPTTLNQWKRTIYHDEDPLKLYNIANAPSWYVSDKEKDCIFALGFVLFSDGKFEDAKKYWKQIIDYSPELVAIDPRFPNVQKRLLAACNVGYMMFTTNEKTPIKNRDTCLKLQYAEFLYLQEKFDESVEIFDVIEKEQKKLAAKAVAIVGKGAAIELQGDKETAMRCFDWILKQKELSEMQIYGGAIIRKADSLMGTYKGFLKALPLYENYLKKYAKMGKKSDHRKSQYKIIACLIFAEKYSQARNHYKKFDQSINDGYTNLLKDMFTRIEKTGTHNLGKTK